MAVAVLSLSTGVQMVKEEGKRRPKSQFEQLFHCSVTLVECISVNVLWSSGWFEELCQSL